MGRGSPIEHPRDIEALFSVDVKPATSTGSGGPTEPSLSGPDWESGSLVHCQRHHHDDAAACGLSLRLGPQAATGNLSLPARGRHAARALARAAGRRGRFAGKFKLLASAAGLARGRLGPGWPWAPARGGIVASDSPRPCAHRDRLGPGGLQVSALAA